MGGCVGLATVDKVIVVRIRNENNELHMLASDNDPLPSPKKLGTFLNWSSIIDVFASKNQMKAKIGNSSPFFS